MKTCVDTSKEHRGITSTLVEPLVDERERFLGFHDDGPRDLQHLIAQILESR
jgi:hypothetical protein